MVHKASLFVSHLRGGLPSRRGTRRVTHGVRCVHGGGLPQVLDVVEDLLVAAARPVPHVVQRAHLPLLHLHLNLLVQDLQERRRAGSGVALVNKCARRNHTNNGCNTSHEEIGELSKMVNNLRPKVRNYLINVVRDKCSLLGHFKICCHVLTIVNWLRKVLF